MTSVDELYALLHSYVFPRLCSASTIELKIDVVFERSRYFTATLITIVLVRGPR